MSRFIVAALALCLLCAWPRALAAERLKPGDRLDAFTAENRTYRDVQIRSVNTHTVIFTHAGGLASARLRDLDPEWQLRFGYIAPSTVAPAGSPSAAPAHSTNSPAQVERAGAPKATPFTRSFVEEVMRNFDQPAALQAEVNLRPKFYELDLNVRSQGRRPSCAVFAIVTALEFQNAQRTAEAKKFSEEYLVWATRKTTLRVRPTPSPEGNFEPADEGFTLQEVLSALRSYGIAGQADMPVAPIRAMGAIEDPPESLIEAARAHRGVVFRVLPGRDNAARINNIVHALNAEVPVPIGLPWPHSRTIRTGYISQQQPMPGAGHAVTLVGYKCPTGRIQDATFLFKNSWGVTWGQGGYGWVTYDYLKQHLQTAVLLDVHHR